MPAKTTPGKPPKHASSGIFSKFKSFATGKGKSLLAILIVLSVVGLGYYGFVRSSADTLGNTPPTVTCGKKLTDKECKQKQIDSDAAFYDQLQKDCGAANRIYANKSCGGCQKGFVDNNGTCKERKTTVDCNAQNRKQDGDFACGGCKNGFAEQASSGFCIAKKDCDAQHRVQKSDFVCGGCVTNFAESNGECKKVVDCAAQNRKQTDQFTCGDCKAGFASPSSTGVCASSAAQANLCAAVFKNFDAKAYACTTCLTGYKADGAKCVKDTTVKLTKADCDAQHRTFNTSTSKCGGCVAGFSANDTGACVSKDFASLTCTAGQVLVDGKCQKSAEGTCDAQHKQYAKDKNVCRDSCQTGFYPSGTKCLELKKPQEDATVKATCDKAFQVYDATTNTCLKKVCIDGYYLKDGACVVLPKSVENCKKNVDGTCSTDSKTVKAACAGQHLEYNSDKNTCRSTCVTDYYLDGDVCKPVGPGNPKIVKASCEKLNLTYSSEANICKPNCKADYVMREGVCVKWEEASMSKWRCNALGRVWVPEASVKLDDGTTQTTAASCAAVCRDTTNTVYTDTNNADTSYCAVKKGLDTVAVGVSTNIDKERCKLLNRAWIEGMDGCAAKCKTGYYMVWGTCIEVQPADTPATQGTGNDGNGTTDGCQSDLQQQPLPGHIVRRSGSTTNGSTMPTDIPTSPTDLVCPDDDPTTPPTESNGGKIKHDVETNLTKEACRLLGRQWVPKGEDADGNKTVAGCSTQDCRQEDAEARKAGGSVYCTGSVLRISKERCENLHRVWSPIVDACLENANSDSTKAKVDAPQCVSPYTVLIRHTAAQGFDECVKPSTYDKLKSVAQDAGKPVAYVASLPAAGICKLRPHMQWVDGQCVKERIANPPHSSNGGQTSGGGDSLTGSTASQTGSTSTINCGVMGIVHGTACPYLNASGCAAKHRAWVNGTCQTHCATHWTNYTVGNPYNYCTTQVSYGDDHHTPTGGGTTTTGNHGCTASQPNCAGGSTSAPTGAMVHTSSGDHYAATGQRLDFSLGSSVTVYTGSWKVCDDRAGRGDSCKSLPSGTTNLCNVILWSDSFQDHRACNSSDAYIVS